eukprot:3577681-Amphidinium_carterae.1
MLLKITRIVWSASGVVVVQLQANSGSLCIRAVQDNLSRMQQSARLGCRDQYHTPARKGQINIVFPMRFKPEKLLLGALLCEKLHASGTNAI